MNKFLKMAAAARPLLSRPSRHEPRRRHCDEACRRAAHHR